MPLVGTQKGSQLSIGRCSMIRTELVHVKEGTYFLYEGESFLLTEIFNYSWELMIAEDAKGVAYHFGGLCMVLVDCKSNLLNTKEGKLGWYPSFLAEA